MIDFLFTTESAFAVKHKVQWLRFIKGNYYFHIGKHDESCDNWFQISIYSSDMFNQNGQPEPIRWDFAPPKDASNFWCWTAFNFCEIWIEIEIFSFRKMHLKMTSAKWCPFCLGLNMSREWQKTWLKVNLSLGNGLVPGFYTKGRLLVESNLICPSDKLSWQHGCPVFNINIQGNFCISQGNGSSDNMPENLV